MSKQYDFSDFDEPKNEKQYDFSDFDEPKNESISSEIASKASPVVGAGIGYGVGETVRKAAETHLPGIAEDLAYRGIGGRTTPVGKKFYTESLGKNVEPDFVNVTPRSIGRQVLDEGILGKIGLASPEEQLISQREISQSKMKDKDTFLSDYDSPDAIQRQDILDEYRKSAGIDNINPTNDVEYKKGKIFENREKRFTGSESLSENERIKAALQGRSNYSGTGVETAEKELNKAQAEARRKITEKIIEEKGGKEALEQFRNIKQRAGNAQKAEEIIARNVLTDGASPGTINKASKFIGELALEKAPAVGAKALDAVGNLAKSKLGKVIPGAGMLLGGAAGAIAAQEAGLSPEEIAGMATAEAVNPIPFTDVTTGYVQGKKTYEETGSIPQALKSGAVGYASPAVDTINEFGKTQSDNARSRMEQNFNSNNLFKKDQGNGYREFERANPDSAYNLIGTLEQSGLGNNQTLKSVVQTLFNSPMVLGKYANVLGSAAQKGPQALATAHYILTQRDPEYAALIEQLEQE